MNYCKKSSIETIVSEIKTKTGIPQSTKIPFENINDTIDSMQIPIQRGSPTTILTNTNKNYTIPKGVYTGGTVSVNTETKTATLQTQDKTITPSSGKLLASVIVPASNVFSIPTKTQDKMKTPATSGATSFTTNDLNFLPKNIIIIYSGSASGVGGVKKPTIAGVSYINGEVKGVAAGSNSPYGVPITNATVQVSQNSSGKYSMTISNIIATENGTAFTATFYKTPYTYLVWG